MNETSAPGSIKARIYVTCPVNDSTPTIAVPNSSTDTISAGNVGAEIADSTAGGFLKEMSCSSD